MHKFKAFLLSGLMALLFTGAILFSGSDVLFPIPWGQVIGAALWVALFFTVKIISRRFPNGPFR